MQRFTAPNGAILHQLGTEYVGVKEIMQLLGVCRATAYNYIRAVPAHHKLLVVPALGRSFTVARRSAVMAAHRQARLQLSPYTRSR